MPDFSFAPIVKTTKAKTSSAPSSKYEILTANVEGVVFITLDGKYIVVIGDDEYTIASEDYSCKNVAEIYEQVLVNDLTRVRHIRSDRDRDDRDRSMYLPFVAGCSVKGNIVKHRTAGITLFKIKKVYIDVDCNIARKAIKFYRENYTIIRKALNKDWIDNYIAEDSQTIIPEVIEDDTKDVVLADTARSIGFSFNRR